MNDLEIVVLSLERTPERKTKFEQFNGEVLKNFNWRFINATDGQKVTSLPADIYAPKKFHYRKGNIGAGLSWIRVWKECIAKDKVMLGLEDDVVLHKDFEKHIQHVCKILPDDFDITLLGYNFDSVLEFRVIPCDHVVGRFLNTKLTDEKLLEYQDSLIHPTIVPLINAFGACSVLLSPQGAKKALEMCLPMDNRVNVVRGLQKPLQSYSMDCQLNSIYKNINAFAVVPPIGVVANLKEESLTVNP